MIGIPTYVYSNLDGMFKERIAKGLSLYEVAAQSELSIRALKDYEARRKSPKQTTYNRLARIYGWEVWK